MFSIHYVNHTLNWMEQKRYPCQNYERLLAAEALPMTKEFTIKADLERFFVLSL